MVRRRVLGVAATEKIAVTGQIQQLVIVGEWDACFMAGVVADSHLKG